MIVTETFRGKQVQGVRIVKEEDRGMLLRRKVQSRTVSSKQDLTDQVQIRAGQMELVQGQAMSRLMLPAEDDESAVQPVILRSLASSDVAGGSSGSATLAIFQKGGTTTTTVEQAADEAHEDDYSGDEMLDQEIDVVQNFPGSLQGKAQVGNGGKGTSATAAKKPAKAAAKAAAAAPQAQTRSGGVLAILDGGDGDSPKDTGGAVGQGHAPLAKAKANSGRKTKIYPPVPVGRRFISQLSAFASFFVGPDC